MNKNKELDRLSIGELSKSHGIDINKLLDKGQNGTLTLRYLGPASRTVEYYEYDQGLGINLYKGNEVRCLDGIVIPPISIMEMRKQKPWMIRKVGEQSGFKGIIWEGEPALELDETSLGVIYSQATQSNKENIKKEHGRTKNARELNEKIIHATKAIIARAIEVGKIDRFVTKKSLHPDREFYKLAPMKIAEYMVEMEPRFLARGEESEKDTKNKETTIKDKINKAIKEKKIPGEYLK